MSIQFLALVLLQGCLASPGDPCAGRSDDSDCDGVPDAWDRCPASPADSFTDRRGCTSTEAAGCQVRLLSPEDGARLSAPTPARWEGDCDVYLLQASSSASFPPGATRTVARGPATEALLDGPERYWRVTGGLRGVSSGAHSPPRETRWR